MTIPLRTGVRIYLLLNAWAINIAVLSIIAAVFFYVNPDSLRDSAIGQVAHPFDYVWNAAYLLGGVLMLVGILTRREEIDIAGLWMLGMAVLGQCVAIVAVVGWRVQPLVIYGTVTMTCAARIQFLATYEVIIVRRTAEGRRVVDRLRTADPLRKKH